MTDMRDRKTILSVAYGGLLVLCLLLGTKVISLGPLAADGSQLPYALILSIVAIVTEVQGEKAAKRLIYAGLAFQVVALCMIGLTMAMPFSSDADPARVRAFELLVGQNARMIIAGMTSYLVVTTIIRKVQSALSRSNAMTLGKRSMASNLIGQAADTVVYLGIAFYAIHPLGPLMAGQFMVKAAIGILLVPVIVRFGSHWFAGTGELPNRN
ncbi:queuosine precursor transporter [uncultured Salinicola sp.]|uniref:queuosine precursor transporter n=1 Tax=uncultured Salinicola sp. TaxID=1193542 RepID=UPI00261E5E4F|nr:queuosine precursor transporter [uncultured Salinicola sp.]|tara:strand:+ start:1866 stop:2501 length:636 start_codon:yes stop_codon:yes gene_type:complete